MPRSSADIRAEAIDLIMEQPLFFALAELNEKATDALGDAYQKRLVAEQYNDLHEQGCTAEMISFYTDVPVETVARVIWNEKDRRGKGE